MLVVFIDIFKVYGILYTFFVFVVIKINKTEMTAMSSTTELPITDSTVQGSSTINNGDFQSTDYTQSGSGINILFNDINVHTLKLNRN